MTFRPLVRGSSSRRSASLRLFGLASLVALATTFRSAPAHSEAATVSSARWTDVTPDAMIEAQVARARAATTAVAKDADALAAMAIIEELAPRAADGHAEAALTAIAGLSNLPLDIRTEARLAVHALSAEEGSEAGAAADRALGVATELAVLGPFRDTGGGLAKREAPEAGRPAAAGSQGKSAKVGASDVSAFADRRARYSWGTVDVSWRTIPRTYAQASGTPLDVFVAPRKESCTLLATAVTLDAPQTIGVRIAAAGQVRLMFDGSEIASSEDVHAASTFDRLGGKVEAPAGAHLVWAKVCAGALDDGGQARIRFSDADGAPLVLKTSADLVTPAAPKKDSPKVQKVPTPLERMMATAADSAGNDSAIDTTLDGAVTRTLAGADDLKSPRAPGILDSLAQIATIDADHLAMVGWIAASGANRSGWLNRARDLAAQKKDDRTFAFVERRLVAEHLGARMNDWAMAVRKAAKLDDQTDSEAKMLCAMVDAALGTDALALRALHTLQPMLQKDKSANSQTPDAALQQLSRLAGGFDPGLSRDAREELARRGLRDESWVEAESTRGKDFVVKSANEVFEGSLADADEGLTIAREVSDAGDHRAAQALYGKIVQWAPNRAEGWSGLAQETAATAGPGADANTTEAVTASLRRARELAPGDSRTRAELALRTTGGRGAEPGADEKYLVPSSVILAKRQGVATKGIDVADRELYWLRAVTMHEDNRVSQLIHYAREIVIAPRTDDELYEDLPAEGELTELLRARVHKKDGGTAFPTEEHNEGSRPRVRWPELAPGDTVEVALRTWTSTAVGGRGDAPFYFLDYAGAPATHPLSYNEVIVDVPKAHPIWVDVIGAPEHSYERTERDEGSRHFLRLVWQKPAVVPEEPLAPNLSETVPLIVGSTFHNWSDFRAWYGAAVQGFTDPDAEVRRLAADLTKGKTTKEAKLAALFDFVSDDIRYVNYVSGEWWLPNRPQQLLARREGDCDDKAILLITLLKSVGIEAQEVMVQTRMTAQPSVLLAKGAAVPMFDHGIAWLPGPNGGRYLDATSPQSRLGPVPSMDARAVALRMEGPPTVVTLPASTPDDHGSDVTWDLTMKADGSAELAGEEKHMGDSAFFLRTYLREPDARAQYVEDNLVGPWFPTVQVDKKIDFKGDGPNGQAWVKYSAHSEGLARRESNELVVPISPSQTLASQLAPLPVHQRTLPVVLPPYLAPSHQSRTLRVVAAPGFAWVDPPSGGTEEGGEFGRAELSIAKDPKDAHVMIIKRKVTFDASTIPVEKYNAWRLWLQKVDALMHKTVRMTPAGGAQ